MKDSDWEILYELYKNPNMTKVAQLLYMTQPSLTKRLQYMETEFQVTIVNRTPKGLAFTPEGEYLAKQAKKYIDFMSETQETLKKFKEKQEQVITIGSSYTYSKYTLTDILVKYKAEHPQIDFEIVNAQSNLLFRKVLEGSVDVGFIRGDYNGQVHKVLIGENQAYLVTKEPVGLDELAGMQRIGYTTNDRTLEILNHWWRDHFSSDMPSAMNVGYIDFAWQLINKGLGYTCCFLPDNFENEYDLCLTPLSFNGGQKVIRNTWFMYPKSKMIPDILADFIHYIETELKQ